MIATLQNVLLILPTEPSKMPNDLFECQFLCRIMVVSGQYDFQVFQRVVLL